MDAIIRFILHLSTLEVTKAKISNATKDSFVLSMDAQVKGTGPFPATISPMEVDICHKGTPFAKLALPAVKIGFTGARIKIQDQTVNILDMPTFEQFIVAVVYEKNFTLDLKDGDCTVKAFGMTGRCKFEKSMELKGMDGLATHIKSVSQDTVTFVMDNPSPMEMDHGVTTLAIRDVDEETIAHLKGALVIKQGETLAVMSIARESGLANKLGLDDIVWLVGTGTVADAWTDRTVQFLRAPIVMDEKFLSFFTFKEE